MSHLDELITALQGKNVDTAEVLAKRDRVLSETRSMPDLVSRANTWTGSRESHGMFMYLVGEHKRALRVLENEASQPAARLMMALAALEQSLPERALSAAEGIEGSLAEWLRAKANMQLGNWDEAERLISGMEGSRAGDLAVKLLRVEYDFRNGNSERASQVIDDLIDSHPTSREAMFLGALISDRGGDEDGAVERYERLTQMPPVSADVLINLGVLYEDQGDNRLAVKCYRTVLKDHPNHERANLYLKDAEASMDMFYDEEREKREDKRLQVLRTPVTDFELSVRSKNCLHKMKIETLGDLISKTEQELLSYKNFGETSLMEIKRILGSKGLRLGMTKDEALKGSAIDEALERAMPPQHEGAMADSVDSLELNVRARKCMEKMNVRTIGDLCAKSEQELLATPNFGATSLVEVKRKLAVLGLSLRDD
jgi:DNA-directed RNA polymerase subunit alpha